MKNIQLKALDPEFAQKARKIVTGKGTHNERVNNLVEWIATLEPGQYNFALLAKNLNRDQLKVLEHALDFCRNPSFADVLSRYDWTGKGIRILASAISIYFLPQAFENSTINILFKIGVGIAVAKLVEAGVKTLLYSDDEVEQSTMAMTNR